MGDMLLQASTNKPGGATLTLVDGSVDTGYRIIGDPDWGNAEFEVLFSGPRGTQGARAAGSIPRNRTIALALRVTGSTKDQLAARISAVHVLVDEWRRFGGRLTWRSKNQTFRQHFEVLAGSAVVEAWRHRSEHSNIADITLAAVCAPYLLGDPMDITDDFSTDRLTEYVFDSGASSNVAVAAGELDAVLNLTTENRAIHTYYGYTYGDHQATVKSTPGATITSYKAGVVLKRIDNDDYIEVYVDDNGTNSRLRLDKVVGDSRTNLSTTNLGSRIVAGTPFWARGRIEGNVVYLEYFLASTFPGGPTPMGTPTTSASYQMTTGEAAAFGLAVEGRSGFVWIPQHTDAKLDDLEIAPYTYRNITFPSAIAARGTLPGDAPAVAEALITPSGGASPPIAALAAWWSRPAVWNMIWNGDHEFFGGSGWSIGAITNISAGCTSAVQVGTAAKFGTKSLEVTCPATIDAGTVFQIERAFKRGTPYTLELWVRAPSATTLAYARLGNGPGNDKASSSSVALSTTWTKHTVTWTPSADREIAFVAVNIGAATATVFQVDGISVVEGTAAPVGGNQIEGRGGFPPFGIVEAEANTSDAAGASGGTYQLGLAVTFSIPGTLTRSYVIDPSLAAPDDHTQQELAVEVWARVEIPSTATSVIAVTSAVAMASTSFGTNRYTDEFGAAGRSLVLPNSGTRFRFCRLGTLRLDTRSRWFVRVTFTTLGSGTLALDYLMLVPSGARVLSPTGKPDDATYPDFVDATTEVTKRIRSDLSATVSEAKGPEATSNGLGGSLIELPPGHLDVLLKLSSLVPDNPTADGTTEQLAHSATAHLAVTPRWHLARAS